MSSWQDAIEGDARPPVRFGSLRASQLRHLSAQPPTTAQPPAGRAAAARPAAPPIVRTHPQPSASTAGAGATEGPSESDLEFATRVQQLGATIQEVNKNVHTLQRLTESLGTVKDSHDVRHTLHVVMETTNRLSQDAHTRLRELTNHPRATADKACRLRCESLKREFQAALSEYERASQEAIIKQKQFVAKARQRQPPSDAPRAGQPRRTGGPAPAGKFLADDAAVQREEETRGLLAMERERLQQQEEETRFNDMLIQEREESIRELERSVLEINQMFKDLANLVQQQGEMIDNIETNIQMSLTQVEQAEEQIVIAKNHQSSFRCKLCVILLVAVLLAGVIATAIILAQR